MSKYKSIIVIICYAGKLPWYFAYFVHTCRFNPTVDFLVITDDRSWSNPLPSNVRMVYADLSDINEVASQKLGFKTNILDGYKINDIKPAYGCIFSDFVEGYDFWGHGDIDVVYGDIRGFIANDIMEDHDLISVRNDFITGYFLLFKNNDFMNSLFIHSKDYKKVMMSDKHYCFDETNFQYNEFAYYTDYPPRPQEIESMMHVVDRLRKEGAISVYFDFHVIEGLPGNITWNKGKLFYKEAYEAMLYHMVKFKNVYKPTSIPKEIPDYFTISSTEICHERGS